MRIYLLCWNSLLRRNYQRKLKNEEERHKDDVNDCVTMPETSACILFRMLVVIRIQEKSLNILVLFLIKIKWVS